MSRVGLQPISVSSAVEVKLDGDTFTAKGSKGEVSQAIPEGIEVVIEDGEVLVRRADDSRDLRSKHGLIRSLLANAVEGVEKGFEKELEIEGVGYRGEIKGGELHLALGFSHPVVFPIPEGIEIAVEKNTEITVTGADRQQVGQVAAELRSLRPPDPYKGKGIRYKDEQLHLKVGKAGAAGAAGAGMA
ncbi:MAG: 50S ribosomal protein L6 [Thermoanaerobaculia bacterium]|nr:50S ribosomal protein L6 [Thermoanaerobaculia bacterium]